MAVTHTILGVNKFNNGIELFIKHTISGNYATPGESVDYNLLLSLPTTKQPSQVNVEGESGYEYRYDKTNKRLKTMFGDNNNAADGPLIEIPDAAYPAAVIADSIIARVVWLRP